MFTQVLKDNSFPSTNTACVDTLVARNQQKDTYDQANTSSLIVIASTSAPALASSEFRLGAISVTDRTDRDVIALPRCNGAENRKVNSIDCV